MKDGFIMTWFMTCVMFEIVLAFFILFDIPYFEYLPCIITIGIGFLIYYFIDAEDEQEEQRQ